MRKGKWYLSKGRNKLIRNIILTETIFSFKESMNENTNNDESTLDLNNKELNPNNIKE
jgi:hypothetical protein